MRTRRDWSALVVGAATIWLAIALWLSLAHPTRGLDYLVLGLALFMQVAVVLTWDFLPRLPLWVIAGHGLIMVSLAVGFVISAPAGAVAPGVSIVPPAPWLVVGLVPTGLAMIVAAALHWQRSDSLVH